MLNRRGALRALTALSVATTVVVGSVFADELIGVITKVDRDAKKLTVVEKGTDKEVVVQINDDTEYVSKKGTSKLDLEKIEARIERAKEKGAKGIRAKITHEKNVASRIEAVAKKKAAAD